MITTPLRFFLDYYYRKTATVNAKTTREQDQPKALRISSILFHFSFTISFFLFFVLIISAEFYGTVVYV